MFNLHPLKSTPNVIWAFTFVPFASKRPTQTALPANNFPMATSASKTPPSATKKKTQDSATDLGRFMFNRGFPYLVAKYLGHSPLYLSVAVEESFFVRGGGAPKNNLDGTCWIVGLFAEVSGSCFLRMFEGSI